MAWIGFKKTYAPGAFDNAAVLALFDLLKSTLVTAGFSVKLDTPTLLEVIQAGATTQTDDTPHWAFEVMGDATSAAIQTHIVHGVDFNDPDAIYRQYFVCGGEIDAPETIVWFAANGVTGGWWLYSIDRPEGYPDNNGNRFKFCRAGATSRRYLADTHQGLCARYGMWDPYGDWEPAYARNVWGDIDTTPWTGTWSPLGEGWSNNGLRHPASPLPKLALPQFPNRDGGITACVLGELNEILALTDGYALEEVVAPGWIALITDQWSQPFAVPAPDSFTLL